MLTLLRLRNFKTWEDTGRLPLAPITVLFGTNSSGKSSLGQFLLMLRRTVEQPDRRLVFHTSDERNPLDLGNYLTYVYDNDEKRDIEFTISSECATPLELKDPLHDRVFVVRELAFDGHVGLTQGKQERVITKSLTYRVNPSKGGKQDVRIALTKEPSSTKYHLTSEGFDAVRKQMRVWPLPPPNRFYGFPDELFAYYQNVAGFADLQLELERVLKSLHYLGPLRQYPRREYTWTGQTPGDVGFQGENSIATLLAGAERSISPGKNKRYQPLQGFVGAWLQRLGVIEGFRLVQVSKLTRSYQVRLKMPGRTKEVTLPDVGFGVSQVLPVVTAAFCAPANATIVIEQPELHLHPKVQADLADLFVEAIRSRENGEERRIQFLIESHSEHFLRRLQRRVAEQILPSNDLAAYVCEPATRESGSSIKPLDLDDFGRIKNWPKNFFGDQMTDIAEMRKAGLQREMSSAGTSTKS
ncbi:MAG TPA: DUF3696 domain-containing protein [Chthoniobacterales bacterium]|jgi:predicted ATPase|nr:DUF3696 domain-containing protein [Chthoniobacterales bacterium]